MGQEFAFVAYDRSEFLHDLLSYKGMSREARIRKREADIKKAEKEAAKVLGAAESADSDEPAAEPPLDVVAGLGDPSDAASPGTDATDDTTSRGAPAPTPPPPPCFGKNFRACGAKKFRSLRR